MKPASRSAGTRSAPCAHWVRFTEAWNDDLHKAAREQGKTIQSFLHDAAVEAISRTLEAKDRRRDRREQQERVDSSVATSGFGIRDALRSGGRRTRPRLDDEPEMQQSQPQIVVHTAPTAAVGANVNQLATYVAKGGPQWQRDSRRRKATEIIVGSTTDVEERHQLEKALDDQILKLTGEPRDIMARIKRGLFK